MDRRLRRRCRRRLACRGRSGREERNRRRRGRVSNWTGASHCLRCGALYESQSSTKSWPRSCRATLPCARYCSRARQMRGAARWQCLRSHHRHAHRRYLHPPRRRRHAFYFALIACTSSPCYLHRFLVCAPTLTLIPCPPSPSSRGSPSPSSLHQPPSPASPSRHRPAAPLRSAPRPVGVGVGRLGRRRRRARWRRRPRAAAACAAAEAAPGCAGGRWR
ncbi:hypothetical protein B0H12DRAFT_425265 [Mycena haematopus]|nr:hypothetical protein B0H12DRAFT_425265 [Mycena haematopus]